MPKPRGDVEISSSFTWFCQYHTCSYSFLVTLHLPNRKDPNPATYKSINAVDIPQN